MKFPIVIHVTQEGEYVAVVPDIPGCQAKGETLDEAIDNATSAIQTNIEIKFGLGEVIEIMSSKIEDLAKLPAYADAIWSVVTIDLSKLDKKAERINISLPRFVLSKIDAYIFPRYESRSGFLARAALYTMASETKN